MEHWENLSLTDIEEYVEGVGLVKEEWKDVLGYEGLYIVSSFGRIKSLQRVVDHRRCGKKTVKEKIKRLSRQSKGYLNIGLSKNGIEYGFGVHVLVGIAFIPNPDGKATINHMYGVKDDNRVSHLEWATSKEQDEHARRTGLKVSIKGEAVPSSKLSNEAVIYIFNSTDSIQLLAAKFSIKEHAIWDIKRGNTWRHITGKEPDKKRILTKEDILGMYNSTSSLRKTANEYGVESTTVFNIKHGLRYADITGAK